MVLLNEPRYHVNNLIIVDQYDNSNDNDDNQYCYSSIINDGFLLPKDLNFTEEAIDTMEYNIWDDIKNTKDFYDFNKIFLNKTDLYIREYIKYFNSVSYATNLRLKIQKNVIDDLEMNGELQEDGLILNSRLEDLNEMTAALKKCEQNAVYVNTIVKKIRSKI